MSRYLDTSVVVSALIPDSGTAITQAWLSGRVGETLVISDWTVPEVSSAISMKVRAGELKASDKEIALRAFDRLTRELFSPVAVSRTAFRTAARFVERHELGLRPADALHLAIAAEHGLQLCTRDRRQAEAGAAVGVSTELV